MKKTIENVKKERVHFWVFSLFKISLTYRRYYQQA